MNFNTPTFDDVNQAELRESKAWLELQRAMLGDRRDYRRERCAALLEAMDASRHVSRRVMSMPCDKGCWVCKSAKETKKP